MSTAAMTKEAIKATKAAEKEAARAAKAAEKEAKAAAKAAEKAEKAAAKLARTAATVAFVPEFLRYDTQPPVEAYHPYNATGADMTHCLGRRTDSKHEDRRWTPSVYGAYQCRNKPVSGSDLCSTCLGHEAKGTHKDGWNGRVTEELPADSHCAGSAWAEAKAKWTGVAKPKTRRQAERAEKRRTIPDVELRRFILGRGAIELDIERLSTVDNQITVQQLIDMICLHQEKPTGATSVSGTYRTRKALCAVIRKLMDPTVTEKPRLTFTYPAAAGGAGTATPPSLEVSEAEEDTGDEEATEALRAELEAAKVTIVTKDAKIAELEAALAAKDAKLSAITAALSLSA